MTRFQAAQMLSVNVRAFDQRKAALIALCGLKEIIVGRSRRYLKSSVERICNEYLCKKQAAAAFDMSLRSFNRFKSYYIAHCGLKEITIASRKFYTRTSINKIIENAIETGTELGVA